jgi:hypothetical protein
VTYPLRRFHASARHQLPQSGRHLFEHWRPIVDPPLTKQARRGARDEAKWRRGVAKAVAKGSAEGEKAHEESPATLGEREASDDSRGGTRTRDPGIMSAVL